MTITEATRATIIADASMSAVGDRIYPNRLDKNPVLPAIVTRLITGSSLSTMAGAHGRTRMRIELTVWGPSYLVCEQLCMKLWALFKAKSGAWVTGAPDAQVFQIMGPRSLQSPDNLMHCCQIDLMVLADMDTAS